MADFVAVLKKTLDGMGETTPATRARVYEKARSTISAKLAALNPLPPPAVADRQRRSLEDAIAQIEKQYAIVDDPLAELENVFASLKNPQPKPLSQPPAPRPTSLATPLARPASPQVSTRPVPPPAPPVARTMPPAAGPAFVRPAQAQPQPARPAAVAPPAEPRRAPPPPEPFKPAQPSASRPDSDSFFDEDDTVDFADDVATGYRGDRGASSRKRSIGPFIVAALVLAVIAGGGYGIWLNRDAFGGLFGVEGGSIASAPPASEPAAPVPAEPLVPEPADTAAAPDETAPADTAPADAGAEKFTQRLTADGTEEDAGSAGGESGLGEGTSIAAVTQPPSLAPAIGGTPAAPPAETAQAETPPADTAPADPAAAAAASPPAETAPAAAEPALAVGQRAIFYEERTAASEGSAGPGSVVWSLVQESPGNNLPPEPAIRAEATIPGKDLQLRMTVRRNADPTLPASHIIEMIFLTPPGFEGGGINNILRVAMKSSEQEAGSPLIGIPAKIADGFFLVALNDTKAETDANLALLDRQSWIDVPVVYKSGRRALFTMEKGVPGEKVFADAIKAWQASTAG